MFINMGLPVLLCFSKGLQANVLRKNKLFEPNPEVCLIAYHILQIPLLQCLAILTTDKNKNNNIIQKQELIEELYCVSI